MKIIDKIAYYSAIFILIGGILFIVIYNFVNYDNNNFIKVCNTKLTKYWKSECPSGCIFYKDTLVKEDLLNEALKKC